jgi:hypothetical protein
MQDLSELDELVSNGATSLERQMAEFYSLELQRKAIVERLKDLKDTIAAEADEEPGEYEVVAGEFIAKVKRPEKYTWDDAILETIVGGIKLAKGGIPDAVSTQLRVDKKKYDALPVHEKALLSPALTIGPGADSVRVVKKGEGEEDVD